jgi:riboflavin synthase
MFTGIIEATGIVKKINREETNLRISIQCPFTPELKIDQSIAHNGVCLTVIAIDGDIYDVIVIDETIKRTNFDMLKEGDEINLERSMKAGDRLDGHIVQGHVDTRAKVKKIVSQNGSWLMHFEYENEKNVTVEKGSVCVNGVSLTVVESGNNYFSTAIIPYTFQYTNFKNLRVGDLVNVEFDIIGKYVSKLVQSPKY